MTATQPAARPSPPPLPQPLSQAQPQPQRQPQVQPVPEQPPRRTTYREVFAEPRFRVLFTTRSVSIVADSLRISTLSVLVFADTRSAFLSALTFGVGFLPQMGGSMLFGPLSDRLRPRALISGGYALAGIAAVALALPALPIAAGLLILAVVALLTPVFGGASSRLVAEVLTGDAYVLGRSMANLSSSAAQIAGLGVGGLSVAALGPRRALLLAAAMQFAVALTIRLRLPDLDPPTPQAAEATNQVVRSSWAGNAQLLRSRPIRRLLLAQWLPCAFVAGAEGLIVAYAGERRFAVGAYGILLACLPIGMLVGDVVVGRFLRPPMRRRLVVPLIVVLGVPLLGFAAGPSLAPCAVALLVCGTGFSYGLGIQADFLAVLPEERRGQAFGLLSSGVMTLQGLGPVLFGALATLLTTGDAMAAAGVATMLTAGWIRLWLGRGEVSDEVSERLSVEVSG